MDKRQLIKYISAFTMGDGGVYYSGKECRFVSNQLEKHRDYIEWRAEILEGLTSVNLHVSKQEGKQDILSTTTRTHPTYTAVRKRLYIDGYKSVDPHYLSNLDWEMVSILFQDDGSACKDKRSPGCEPTVCLHLKRLSYGDQLLLKKAFKDKLEMEFNVQRHYDRWYLRLRSKDSSKFLSSVKSFIKPSFEYKLV
jgi:hypothetical protein